MRINNNIGSINAQSAFAANNATQAKSMLRLATAMKINNASDDAAGLAVSESLRAQVRGNQMSQRNAGDGLAMLQIADTGSQQITDSLQRMRELAIQSGNGTLNDNDRKAIQDEYSQLQQQISGVAESTTYNGQPLLKGGAGVSFQVGDQSGSSTIGFQNSTDLSGNLGLGAVDSQTNAQSAMDGIDKALQSLSGMRSNLGSTMNRLDATVTNLGNSLPNLAGAESQIRDTDFASETTQLAKSQILGQSSMAMIAQANQLPAGIMNFLRQ
jgi:flagellin